MRCLYCGNELALLKKLTGGGEFCSEAHRQKYQEEYNRLALSRLLQAQPASKERPPLESTLKSKAEPFESNVSDLRPEKGAASNPPARPERAIPSTRPTSVPPPARSTPAPPRSAPPPPEWGFIIETFEPMLSPQELFSSEPFLSPIAAFLPQHGSGQVSNPRLAQGGPVPIVNPRAGWDTKQRTIQLKSLEPRDFARPAAAAFGPRPHPSMRGPAAINRPVEVPIDISSAAPKQGWDPGPTSPKLRPEFRLNAGSWIPRLKEDEVLETADLHLTIFSDIPDGQLLEFYVEEGSGGKYSEIVDESAEISAPPVTAIKETELPAPLETPISVQTEAEPAPSEAEAAVVPLCDSIPQTADDTKLVEEVEDRESLEKPPEPPAPLPVPAPAAAEVIPAFTAPARREVYIDLSMFGDEDEAEPTPTVAAIPATPAPGPDSEANEPQIESASPSPALAAEPEAIAEPAQITEPEQVAEPEQPAEAVVAAAASEEPAHLEAAPPTENASVSEPEPTADSHRVVEGEALLDAQPAPVETTAPVAAETSVEDSSDLPAAQPVAIPKRADSYFAVEVTPAAGTPVAVLVNAAITGAGFRVVPPTLDGVPLRTKMIFAPRPESKQPPAPVEAAVPPAAVQERQRETPEQTLRNSKERRRNQANRPTFVSPKDAEPTDLTETPKSADNAKAGDAAKAEVPKPVEAAKPVDAKKPADIRRPADNKNPVAAAKPVEKTVEPSTPAGQPAPITTPRATASSRLEPHDGSLLHLDSSLNLGGLRDSQEPKGSAWTRLTTSKRIAIAVGLVLALCIGGFLLKSTFASKTADAPSVSAPIQSPASLITDPGGWNSDWNGAAPKEHQISIYRSSLDLSDYRIKFEGTLQDKPLAWVFRAANPKNYYVTSLELKKNSPEPVVTIAHYAVINGEDTQRIEKPLPFPVHLDTVYDVRTDVFGTQFKTYIREKLVDEWSDDRLKSGAFGVVGDSNDRIHLRFLQLFGLKGGN